MAFVAVEVQTLAPAVGYKFGLMGVHCVGQVLATDVLVQLLAVEVN